MTLRGAIVFIYLGAYWVVQYGPGHEQAGSAGNGGQTLSQSLVSFLGLETLSRPCGSLYGVGFLFQAYGRARGGLLVFTGLIKLDGFCGGVHGWTIPRVSTREVTPSYELFSHEFRERKYRQDSSVPKKKPKVQMRTM